ncbi:predicted protein [Streptomyces viridosporus ATCC 14672]|uniref:Predicted protein n=1 Tax=Streptomyces viridosporus (strain ATCC 14672 / DSM 40746 / JCM 4963 / KCTC 9882 / NRRL B-12104 / FH 1290) TaxID=566461 RepID=D6A745_STRV1|nr:predicted protein [Streptomyces viridosporus ATCC 14672]
MEPHTVLRPAQGRRPARRRQVTAMTLTLVLVLTSLVGVCLGLLGEAGRS